MVGQKAKITTLLEKWLRRPFELGKADCLQMIKEVYGLPDKWRDIDIAGGGYRDLWEKDKKRAISLYLDFIAEHFEEVQKVERRTGDLVLIHSDKTFILGIYLGNGTYLSYNEARGSYVGRLFGNYRVFRRKGWEAS